MKIKNWKQFNEQRKSKYGETYATMQWAIKFKDIDVLREYVLGVYGSIWNDDDRELYEMLKTANWKTLVKYAKEYMKKKKIEVEEQNVINNIRKEIERIHKNKGITVRAHADCPEDKKIQFVTPIFTGHDDTRYALEYLKNSEEIRVEATPRVVDKWYVEYDGEVTNDKGDTIEFEGVNNNLAVNLG